MKRVSQAMLLCCATTCMVSCVKKGSGATIFSEHIVPSIESSTPHTEFKSTAQLVKPTRPSPSQDSIAGDSLSSLDCYIWSHQYTATTRMMHPEDDTEFELNILINLSQQDDAGTYWGGMVLYVSEEDYVEANVRGVADGNTVTIYYVESPENTTDDLFKDGDKLVRFEIIDGEYEASWFKPMHKYVDEYTIISIR